MSLLTLKLNHKAEAQELARQIGRWEIDKNAPEDLQDKKPLFYLAEDGRRIWSHILPEDFMRGGKSPVVQLIGMSAAVGISATMPMYSGLIIPALMYLTYNFLPVTRDARLASSTALLREPSARADEIRRDLEARHSQSVCAKPLAITLGTSTGRLSARGDIFGADEGMQMGLSIEDLSTHIWIFGRSGSGKTSCLLKPILTQWKEGGHGGLLVLDFKGALPEEVSDKVTLLAPDIEGCLVALLGNLEPSIVVELLAPEAKTDDIWSTSGVALLYTILVCIKAAGWRYTIKQTAELVNNPSERIRIVTELDKLNLSVVAEHSRNELSKHHLMESEKTRSSIEQTVLSWLNPLLTNPFLFAWCDTDVNDGGYDVTRVFQGEAIGINVPAFRFGSAAVPVTKLLSGQIYQYAKNRGNSWKEGDVPVMLVVDEAALGFGAQESAIAPIARSLGLYFVAACQNKNQVTVNCGVDGAPALLDNFGTIVSFKGNEETNEYIASRAGEALIMDHVAQQTLNPMTVIKVDAGGIHGQGMFDFVKDMVKGVVESFQKEPSVGMGEIVVKPAVPEFMNLVRGECFAIINRGGQIRRDTIMTNHIGGTHVEMKRMTLPPLSTPKVADIQAFTTDDFLGN